MTKQVIPIILLLFSVLPWQSVEATELQSFQARYAVYRNGKLIGKMDMELALQGESWKLTSEAGGTHGLARILGARDSEYAEGHLLDGRFRPDRYKRHTRIAGMDDEWAAEFNWETGAVSIKNDDGQMELGLGNGAFDPLSLGLELRKRLGENNPALLFSLVADDKLKNQQFRTLDPVHLETSLGCLETMPVERVRNNNKRYTRAWHAPELDFISVRLEHGKTGGNHMELRITELTLGDSPIEPRPGCSSMQGRTSAG